MTYLNNDVRELNIFHFTGEPRKEKVHTFKYNDGMISHCRLLKVPSFYSEEEGIPANDYLFWVKNGNMVCMMNMQT